MVRDAAFARQVAEDYTNAGLTARERALADFAVKITRAPDACSLDDIRGLRQIGLSDKDILSLVEIVAYQNMSTRIMEALSTVAKT